MSLNAPRLNQFTAFFWYVVACWLFLFCHSIILAALIKISGFYFYLTYATAIFLRIIAPCVGIFYLALIFQAASYDVDAFVETPIIEIGEQPHHPRIKIAMVYLVCYWVVSLIIAFCFYALIILVSGHGAAFKPTVETVPDYLFDFYQQDFWDVIHQQFCSAYAFFINTISTVLGLGISIILLLIGYILTLVLGYGGALFCTLCKVIQRNLWCLNV